MKTKIYTILILFSFLVILGHGIIPHHHHDAVAEDSMAVQHTDGEHSHHHGNHAHHSNDDNQQKKEPDSNDRQKNSFPLHFHAANSHDYDFLRLRISETPNQTSVVLALFAQNISDELFNSTACEPVQFTRKPPLIKPRFIPGAIGLRAPPAIS